MFSYVQLYVCAFAFVSTSSPSIYIRLHRDTQRANKLSIAYSKHTWKEPHYALRRSTNSSKSGTALPANLEIPPGLNSPSSRVGPQLVQMLDSSSIRLTLLGSYFEFASIVCILVALCRSCLPDSCFGLLTPPSSCLR